MGYSATIELDVRWPSSEQKADTLTDQLFNEFGDYSIAVGRSTRGRAELVFLDLPADSLLQAARTALAVVAAGGFDPLTLELLPNVEFKLREDEPAIPPLLSVTETAVMLGVGRARVQQLIDGGQLAAVKIGAVWAVLRKSAAARAAARAERPEVITYSCDGRAGAHLNCIESYAVAQSTR